MSGKPAARMSIIQAQTYRENTALENAVDEAWDDAEEFFGMLPDEKKDEDELVFHPQLADALFVGHLVADCDAVASAIGGACLHKGIATVASDLNSETRWALKKWGCETPPRIEDMMKEDPKRSVCLTDFNQQSQLNEAVPMSNIVGIIDHHALQNNTVVTEKPIYIDIRPWGSAATILAHTFAIQKEHLPKNVAGMLLSAILSDTLNLKSPTKTDWDARMVSMLVQYLDIDDVDVIAAEQFRAKSHELSIMTAYQLVHGDTKKFKFADASNPEKIYTVGYGVIETTDAPSSMARMDELIEECNHSREDEDLAAMFVAVVDIVNLTSMLLIASPAEASLALAGYGGELEQDGKVLPLKGMVSRKKDFLPPITKAFDEGWKPDVVKRKSKRKSNIVMKFDEYTPGRLTRVFDDLEEGDE